MMTETVNIQADIPGPVRQISVPLCAPALSELARIDYADTFLVDVDVDVDAVGERTAEQWAREVLEGAPASMRRSMRSGWAAIGLKLDGAPPERCVLGWSIRRSAPEFVLLGAESRIGMPSELLFKCERAALLFATFVQQDNPIARGVWAATEPVHVPFVRKLLGAVPGRVAAKQGV